LLRNGGVSRDGAAIAMTERTSMRASLVQFRCVVGDVSGNVRRMVERVAEAATKGSELVLFPEMSDTGYEMDAILREATAWETGGSSARALAEAARRHRVAVVAGLAERTAEGIFNAIAVFDRDGDCVATYRKTHLMRLEPTAEARHLRPGTALCAFTLAGFRFGLVVCYEVRFPEVARALALAGAEVLVVPAAFPAARRDHWKILTQARAVENQAYVLAVNRVGTDGTVLLGGASRVVDPWGIVEAAGSEDDETVLDATLERARLARVRAGLRVFEDRRESVYGTVRTGAKAFTAPPVTEPTEE
jgi:predicted amidohydrolase